MEEELSEPDEDSLAEDFDLKENSLLLRKQNRSTARTSDPGYVVRKIDSAIHRINHYPVDNVVSFVNIYKLDSDLSRR